MLPRGPAVTGGDHSSCGRFLSGPLIDLFVSVNRAATRFQTGLASLPLVLEREIYIRRRREIALPSGEGVLIVTRGTSRDTFWSSDDRPGILVAVPQSVSYSALHVSNGNGRSVTILCTVSVPVPCESRRNKVNGGSRRDQFVNRELRLWVSLAAKEIVTYPRIAVEK